MRYPYQGRPRKQNARSKNHIHAAVVSLGHWTTSRTLYAPITALTTSKAPPTYLIPPHPPW